MTPYQSVANSLSRVSRQRAALTRCDDLVDVVDILHVGAEAGADGAHQQGRGDPLADNVADGDAQIRAQLDEVVEVPARGAKVGW
jgi:hypothetical protein